MNSRLGRGILLVLLTGIALLLAASANAQPSGDVLNLAGSGANCLRDPAQLSNLQRERAMLSDRAHRPLAIIALSRDDAEPLTRLGQSPLQACEACGVSSNEIWVCIGDPSAVRQALAQGGRMQPQPAPAPGNNGRGPGNPRSVAPMLPAPSGGGEVAGGFAAQAGSLAQAQRWRELQRVAAQWRASDLNSAQAFF